MREWINIINEAILFEGRDAPLYHGTSLYGAMKIVEQNKIRDTNSHEIPLAVPIKMSAKQAKGVSFSRLRSGALRFGPILFAIDQTKLSQNRKIFPVEYWNQSPTNARSAAGHPSAEIHNEAEEFIFGALEPLDRYLIAIEMSQKTFESCKKKDEQYQKHEERTWYEPLLTHPKLKIINIPKRLDYPLV